jgi:hypothetical protein
MAMPCLGTQPVSPVTRSSRFHHGDGAVDVEVAVDHVDQIGRQDQ